MLATLANMRKFSDRRDVVAHSAITGETCSASPGDYWFLADSDCLEDSEGNRMILARRISERFKRISA